MLKITGKRAILFSATLAALAAGTAAIAQADGQPVYDHYYVDQYGNDVGHYRDTCNRYGIGHTATTGTVTPVERTEIYALCDDTGQLHPY